jgi:hypothetical protein
MVDASPATALAAADPATLSAAVELAVRSLELGAAEPAAEPAAESAAEPAASWILGKHPSRGAVLLATQALLPGARVLEEAPLIVIPPAAPADWPPQPVCPCSVVCYAAVVTSHCLAMVSQQRMPLILRGPRGLGGARRGHRWLAVGLLLRRPGGAAGI